MGAKLRILNDRKPILLYDIRSVFLVIKILQVGNMVPELRTVPNLYEYWMLIPYMLMLVNLAYMRMAYGRRLERLFSGMIRLQILRQIMREELVFSHRVSVLLFLNFAMVLGMILFGAIKYYHWEFLALAGWELYLALVGIIAGIYLFKLIFNTFLRKILRDKGLIKEYLFNVFLINKAIGVVLMPFAIAISFINLTHLHFLFIAIGVLYLLFIFFRVFQGIAMSLSYAVSRIYIILYLCTLEILPLMIVWKVFQNHLM